MKKKFLSILVLLTAVSIFATPLGARSRDKQKVEVEKEPDFIFLPKAKHPHFDERMETATEIATANARRHSHHHCWRSVKDALFEANVVSTRPTTKYAWQAGDELEQKFGFFKIDVSDPLDAPLNSILVYGGGGAGHVEFRTAEGFVSDFINPRPSHRPLLGVYVRYELASL